MSPSACIALRGFLLSLPALLPTQAAETLANTMRQIWERIHLRPLIFAAALGILAIHLGDLLALFVLIILFLADRTDWPLPNPNNPRQLILIRR